MFEGMDSKRKKALMIRFAQFVAFFMLILGYVLIILLWD